MMKEEQNLMQLFEKEAPEIAQAFDQLINALKAARGLAWHS